MNQSTTLEDLAAEDRLREIQRINGKRLRAWKKGH